MNFKKLLQANLARPEAYVDAPELAPWGVFADKEPQRIKLRGLDAAGIYLAKEQIAKGSPLMKLALAANNSEQTDGKLFTEAFLELIGANLKTIPHEVRWKQEILVKAAIDEDGEPLFDHQIVAKISEHFPDLFIRLADKALTLSGEASSDLGERSRRSGKIKTLGTASSMPKDEASSSTSAAPISSPSAD